MKLLVADDVLRRRLSAPARAGWGSAAAQVELVAALLVSVETLSDLTAFRCIELSVESGGVHVSHKSVLFEVSPVVEIVAPKSRASAATYPSWWDNVTAVRIERVLVRSRATAV